MKEVKNVNTRTYAYNRQYRVDIVTTSNSYEAYLYMKDCGFKSLMFGVPKKQQTFDDFLAIVEGNVDEYIPLYEADLNTLNSAFHKQFVEKIRKGD